jgi:molybdopterin converting factor small subunit
VKVEVQLFATLVAFLPPESRPIGAAVVEVPADSTVGDLANVLGIPGAVARVTLVNDREASEAHRLAAGDVVTLFPPLAGGSVIEGGGPPSVEFQSSKNAT